MIQNTNKGDWDPELPMQVTVSERLCAHLSITEGKMTLEVKVTTVKYSDPFSLELHQIHLTF